MDKITVASIADTKPSFVSSVEAAATITVGVGELVIAVGTNVTAANNQRVVTALRDLKNALIEADFPVGALAANYASGTPPNRAAYAVANAAAVPALTEDDVVIAYGATFYSAGNSSNIANIIARAIEVFQERVLKLT